MFTMHIKSCWFMQINTFSPSFIYSIIGLTLKSKTDSHQTYQLSFFETQFILKLNSCYSFCCMLIMAIFIMLTFELNISKNLSLLNQSNVKLVIFSVSTCHQSRIWNQKSSNLPNRKSRRLLKFCKHGLSHFEAC